jgi:hypothetical protein
MNFSPINLTKVGLCLITATSSLFLIAKPSQAISANLSSSDFTQNEGLVTGVNGATNGIDNATGNAGFDNFFVSDDFLLLGANSTDTNITTDSRRSGNSVATSIPLHLNSSDLNPANGLRVNFNWVFDGNSLGNVNDKDNFNITLTKNDFSTTATIFDRTVDPSDSLPGYGSGSESVFLTSADFSSPVNATPGDYILQIALNENANLIKSSAAGFNQISVAAVPFEFSPTQGLLAIGGLWGISTYLKRKKAVARLSNDI